MRVNNNKLDYEELKDLDGVICDECGIGMGFIEYAYTPVYACCVDCYTELLTAAEEKLAEDFAAAGGEN